MYLHVSSTSAWNIYVKSKIRSEQQIIEEDNWAESND